MKTKYLHVHRLRRVYVWELPVRYYHWLNAGAIIALIITGFLIADPLALQSKQEATMRYTMGWVRVIHFVASYIFFFNFLFRLYWGFAGNKYASWKQFIPISKKFIKEMWTVFKIDILMLKGKEHISIGHNAMAGFIYFLTFWAFLIQCLTGLVYTHQWEPGGFLECLHGYQQYWVVISLPDRFTTGPCGFLYSLLLFMFTLFFTTIILKAAEK